MSKEEKYINHYFGEDRFNYTLFLEKLKEDEELREMFGNELVLSKLTELTSMLEEYIQLDLDAEISSKNNSEIKIPLFWKITIWGGEGLLFITCIIEFIKLIKCY